MKIPLSWWQLSHQPIRLLIALAGIGFADILMFMQLGFQEALFESNTRVHQKLLADLVLVSTQSTVIFNLTPFPRVRLHQTLSHPEIKSVAPMYVYNGTWKNPRTLRTRAITVFGIDPVKPVLAIPELNQQLNKLKLLNVLLFDAKSRSEYGPIVTNLTEGKTFTAELNDRQITIEGLVNLGTSFATDGNVFTSIQTFFHLFPDRPRDQISIGLIRLKPGADIEAVRQQLTQNLIKDVRVLTPEEFADLEKHYWATSTAIGFIFTIGTGMGFLVGVIIVYQILYTDISNHLPQYATLKAIGYTHRYLLAVVFQEALILAILGYFPGLVISVGLYHLTQGATQLPIIMTGTRAIGIFLLTLAMCTCSGALTVRRLKGADPADIF